jgi:hypothetical protein
MAKRTRGGFDDLPSLKVVDFSAGINSMFGALSLGTNEALITGTQNVIGFPGRAMYAGGFNVASTMPAPGADNAWEFFDNSGVKHHLVWQGGNLYDTASGIYVLIAAGIYTAGEPVGRVDQAGICYYCSPTMPVRQFDGTTEQVVAGDPPTGTYMTAFAGSLIVANPGPFQSAFVPSAVNTPTVWLWANMQTVGTDYGGIISFILPMGVSSSGIPATKSMLVGKSAGNLFMYRGAIGQQEEALVNCPVGCLDPLSAVYVPAPTLFGQVIFLGTDGQLWGCDGVIAEPITAEKNLNYIFGTVNNARILKPTQRFCGSYNERFSYYLLDVGNNQQFIWMWKTKSLFPINGWPSGIYFQGHDKSGYPSNFVVGDTVYGAGVFQVGQDYTTFNGSNPVISYQTPFLHAGDIEMVKDFITAGLATRNLGSSYKVIAKTIADARNNQYTSNPLYFDDPAYQGQLANPGIWDQSQWDNAAQWAADPNFADPAFRHGNLAVPVPASAWVPTGASQALRSGAVSFTISWNPRGTRPPAFDICGFKTRYKNTGMRTRGGNVYTAETGIDVIGVDPWIGTLPTS